MDQPNLKTFVNWIKIKAKVHLLGSDRKYFKERDIWWAAFGQNVGSELNGKNDNFERPVLIFKKVSDTTFWALPITSKTNADNYGHFIFINNKSEPNAIVWTQIRLLSSKRLIRKFNKLGIEEHQKLKSIMGRFLGLENETPPNGGESRSSIAGATVHL